MKLSGNTFFLNINNERTWMKSNRYDFYSNSFLSFTYWIYSYHIKEYFERKISWSVLSRKWLLDNQLFKVIIHVGCLLNRDWFSAADIIFFTISIKNKYGKIPYFGLSFISYWNCTYIAKSFHWPETLKLTSYTGCLKIYMAAFNENWKIEKTEH